MLQPGWTQGKLHLWIAALLLIALLAWGGRKVYCHFGRDMSGSVPARAAAAQDPLPRVTVVNPIRQPAVRSVSLAASVEAFEKATLYAKVAGYLQWIKVDKGDRVRKGQVLALIEVPEMEKEHQSTKAGVLEAQAAYERAQSDAALKELTFKRLANVRESQPDVIAQQEVDTARAAYEVAQGDVKLAKARLQLSRSQVERLETLMEYTKIKSPYNGVVTERYVDPGAMIQQGTSSAGGVSPVVKVVNMAKVRIYVYVPEPDVPFVDRGDPVRLVLDAYPEREFPARITRFAGVLDPQTRTMKTEMDLANPGYLLRPGMYGNATLDLDREEDALFLPAESVRQDADGSRFVFTVTEGRIRKVAVETGLDDGRLTQIRGLEGDEACVLTSTENLQQGLAVTAVQTAP